jgi:hypothetical protein
MFEMLRMQIGSQAKAFLSVHLYLFLPVITTATRATVA